METRLAILRKKSLDWKVRVDESVLLFLAEKIRTNVRRLEGALMRVATFASLAGESVTVDKVEHLLRDLLREEASRQVSIDSIQKAVAEHYDVRLADMTSRRRPASIAFPRQIAMYSEPVHDQGLADGNRRRIRRARSRHGDSRLQEGDGENRRGARLEGNRGPDRGPTSPLIVRLLRDSSQKFTEGLPRGIENGNCSPINHPGYLL